MVVFFPSLHRWTVRRVVLLLAFSRLRNVVTAKLLFATRVVSISASGGRGATTVGDDFCNAVPC